MQTGNWKMKLQATTRGGKGFTLTELLVVVCVVAVVVVLILPMLARPHHHSGLNCVNNLKQIGLAFRIWEGDTGDKFPMQVSVTNGGAMELAVAGDVSAIFRTMSNELSTPKVLVCREDAGRHCATNFTTDLNNQTISYFVALDAEDKYPQMILSGDDNFAVGDVPVKSGLLELSTNSPIVWSSGRHVSYNSHFWTPARYKIAGNIALADGSVQTTTSSIFQSALVNTGTATNRLVIP
jgi:prepilin-type N-terminal cleavage/methylation domain-containing protein